MKIRLAAIAKDEGAYLPEWIYWHLNLGFDDIFLYINNTNDNSEFILKKISKNFPVTVKVLGENDEYGFEDSIIEKSFLKKNPLQSKLYSDIYFQSQNEGYSHVMFLDIDEFLVIDYSNIKLLIENNNEDIIFFNWFNCSGEKKCFSKLKSPVMGEKSIFTKFLIKTNLTDIKFLSTHNVSCLHSSKYLYGRDNIGNNNGIHLDNTGWSNKAFILHRHLRSKFEYISLLMRGDTWNNSIVGFKNNRGGWSKYGIHMIFIPNFEGKSYREGFNDFLYKNNIKMDFRLAQYYILKRANRTIYKVEQIKKLNNELDMVLSGTKLNHVDRRLKNIVKNLYYKLTLFTHTNKVK